MAAGPCDIGDFRCALKGIWIPRHVGVCGELVKSTVRASQVVHRVQYPLTIAEIRHATVAMTHDSYGHLMNDDLAGVAQALGKAIEQARSAT